MNISYSSVNTTVSDSEETDERQREGEAFFEQQVDEYRKLKRGNDPIKKLIQTVYALVRRN